MTMSSRNTTICCVQYVTRVGFDVNTAVGMRAQKS